MQRRLLFATAKIRRTVNGSEGSTMSDYRELIKNFDVIREYMKDFFVYGFKTRSDYDSKSARTYDNERRRLTSWLKGYVDWDYGSDGKRVFLSIDSEQIDENPLYAAWKSKSFTANDIMLHFYLRDLLAGGRKASAAALADEIAGRYGQTFDVQTVRKKLKEYTERELLTEEKAGKELLYGRREDRAVSEEAEEAMNAAIAFFQEAAPFGYIGSILLSGKRLSNLWFRFKHHYLVHTLEDGVLYRILEAMKEQRSAGFLNKSARSHKESLIEGVPLQIFVSTASGRRYVCIYEWHGRRFLNLRLDCILDVEALAPVPDYVLLREKLMRNRDACWGVSFGGRGRKEQIYMKLAIDEKREDFILERLHREGRGGEVTRLSEGIYLYSGEYFDTNEMLSWIKTFIGRILSLDGTNDQVIQKFYFDIGRLCGMYLPQEER